MSSLTPPPSNFLNYNSYASKQLAVVVDIEGLDYLTSTPIGRSIKYGDPVTYGEAGIYYGGLLLQGSVAGDRGQQMLLDLNNSSITISQKLEPEQGRASISTLQMSFIDKDSYMTQAISPGVLIDEILGKEVKIWVGYAQTAFPEDYYLVWRGRVAQTVPKIGTVMLQFTDPNIVRRQQIFNLGQTTLFGAITDTDTTINVTLNNDFSEKIAGPSGAYDQNIKCYLKIEDEFIEYQQTGHESDGYGTDQFLHVVRGARGTTAAAHADQAQVDGYIELSGHSIDMALKLMLSGWNGPYLTGEKVNSFVATGDSTNPLVSNGLVLPNSVDAVRDLGLAIGDYLTISGATDPANDGTCTVIGFENSFGQQNKIILTSKTFTTELTTSAVFSARSQFDVWPDSCGSRLPGWEVDVAGFVYYRNTYLEDGTNSYRFLLSASDADSGKTFIENQILLPLGAYSLTRQGKISMGYTKPPIADDRTTTLDNTNVLNPQSITLTRGLNIRKFFNEIDWTYDYDDTGTALSQRNTIDTDSLNLIGISSILPIDSKGARSDLNFDQIVTRRETNIFARYANGSQLIDLEVNFGTGCLIEVGDVVILDDSGNLQIPNLASGIRNIGIQLFEVINRSIDIKSGRVQLQLQGGTGAEVTDRYATISPSSLLTAASTPDRIVIQDSFGAIYPGQEYKKWQQYVGLKVWIHSPDYTTRSQIVTFAGFDPSNKYAMILSPSLSFTPQAGDILDIDPYPTNTDYTDQALYKVVHAFLDPSVAVASGTSNTVFDVGSGDASKFKIGMPILVHDLTYSNLSPEVTITDVTGTTITVGTSLGFTPDNTMTVELIGFADFNTSVGSGRPYRFV